MVIAKKLASVLLACVLPATARADVWVVDKSGGGDFTQVQPAVDAAQPGDSVLVRPGLYSAFTLTKPLYVIGSGPGFVRVGQFARCELLGLFGSAGLGCDDYANDPGLTVQGIGEGELAMVSGMEIRGSSHYSDPSGVVHVSGNEGLVVLHDVSVAETQYSLIGPGALGGILEPVYMGPALRVEDSDFVLVSSSELHGQDNKLYFDSVKLNDVWIDTPDDAVHVANSTLWLTHSTARGGEVGLYGLNGGAGVLLEDSALYAAGSTITGGSAGIGFPGLPGVVGEPADGVHSSNSAVKAVAGTVIQGGGSLADGFALQLETNSVAFVGPDVSTLSLAGDRDFDFVDASAILVDLDFQSAALFSDTPAVAPGEAWDVTLRGGAADLALLYYSPVLTKGIGDPAVDGLFALSLTSYYFHGMRTLDAAGEATFTLPIPSQPVLSGLVVFLQGLEVGPTYLGVSNPLPLAVL